MDKALKIGLGCVGGIAFVVLIIVILGLAGVIPFGKQPSPPAPAPATAKVTGLPWNTYLTCDAVCNSPKSVENLIRINQGAAQTQGLPEDFIRNNGGARSDGDDNFWAKSDASCSCVADNSAPWESLAAQPAIVVYATIPTGDDPTKYGSGTCDPYCSNANAASFKLNTVGWTAGGGKAGGGSPIPSTARVIHDNPTCTCVPSSDPAHAFPSAAPA